MAPHNKAINATFARKDGDIYVYRGEVDEEWVVAVVPNGGYILGLILEAVVQQQAKTSHPDPIHVTAHFLKSAIVAPFEVHIRILKPGKGFCNLTANFVQDGVDKILTHMVLGTLAPRPGDQPDRTIAPPHPYAARTPVITHPSKRMKVPARRPWNYKHYIEVTHDPAYDEIAKGPTQGMKFGTYVTLSHPDDHITLPSMALLADTFKIQIEVVPDVSEIMLHSWFPSMVMTIEFKFPIPKPTDPNYSSNTVAIYSEGKFINDPNSRFDTYIEIWTAPEIDEQEDEDWREKQRCLAVATQMAIMVPIEVNRRRAQRPESTEL
ncbi:thioesterase-like superfamily-domain-containing protein [Abortiporus biennis]|nr:thioesterase-like superfamily-domain-containing protein [Abortiporus biennis]